MPPTSPSDPAGELEREIELDGEQIALRRWIEEQMVAAGVGEFAAMRLSFLGVDYRRVVRMHQLGMPDELILNDYLEE